MTQLRSGLCIVLPQGGGPFVCEGVNFVELINDAPPDLKIEDGSFFKFVEKLATEYGLVARLEVYEWPHCIRLEEPKTEEEVLPEDMLSKILRVLHTIWIRFWYGTWWQLG